MYVIQPRDGSRKNAIGPFASRDEADKYRKQVLGDSAIGGWDWWVSDVDQPKAPSKPTSVTFRLPHNQAEQWEVTVTPKGDPFPYWSEDPIYRAVQILGIVSKYNKPDGQDAVATVNYES